MSPASALWWSLGLWVAGILTLLWLCIESAEDEAARIERDELADAPAQERGR